MLREETVGTIPEGEEAVFYGQASVVNGDLDRVRTNRYVVGFWMFWRDLERSSHKAEKIPGSNCDEGLPTEI